jgi:hypothetical protein
MALDDTRAASPWQRQEAQELDHQWIFVATALTGRRRLIADHPSTSTGAR